MGITVINFIKHWLSYIYYAMDDIVIFDAYPPVLPFDISLFDVFVGTLTITILLRLLGQKEDDYDCDEEEDD